MSIPKSLAEASAQLAALLTQGLLEPARFQFTAPSGPAATWHVRRFELREGLSAPYDLRVELLTADGDVDPGPLLGARCTLEISRGNHGRSVHGVVHAVQALGKVADKLRVRLEVVPALWLLGQRVDTRFWQAKSVPQILRAVLVDPLKELGCKLELHLDEAAYPAREYCVQHRETDLDFAARLMHEEGFTYLFVHDPEQPGETLVVLDQTRSAPPLIHALPFIPYVPKGTGAVQTQSIAHYEHQSRLQTTTRTVRDWDWQATDRSPYMHSQGGPDARSRKREHYEHDPRRLHEDDGSTRAKHELERGSVHCEVGQGNSDVVELLPGHLVGLYNLPGQEAVSKALLLRVTHTGDAPEEEPYAPAATTDRYHNWFEVLDAKLPYRPQTVPPRPRIHGPHTAIVVGPPNEEIYTDEHGRIRVRFHWDRLSPADETASCWIRVAQTWSGPGWGSVFLPRIGMEVLVEFIDGDPDRPLVTGCVYNSFNRPPYPLPDERTKSTLKSDSSPGGGGSNELRFEDAKGSEEVYIHAQKDLNEVVEHDNTRTVRNNQTFCITANQSFSVGANQSFSVSGNQAYTVTGDRSLTVTKGNDTHTVATGFSTTQIQKDRTVTVVAGNSALTVSAGTHTVAAKKQVKLECQTEGLDITAKKLLTVTSTTDDLKLTAKKNASVVAETATLKLQAKTDVALASQTTKVEIDAAKQIKLKSPLAIDVDGKTVTVTGGEKIVIGVGANTITIDAAGITLSAAKISSGATGVQEITGALVKIN